MDDKPMICPYCGGIVPENTTVCPDCQEDLAALVHLEQDHIIHYNEALALAQEGQLDAAEAKLLVALDKRRDFLPAQTLLAKVYARQGRWTDAKQVAMRVQEVSPEDEGVRLLLGDIERAMQAARVQRADDAQMTASARRSNAERYLASYQRDLASAFGLGVLSTGLLALMISWLGGGRKKR
jgi:tetratricopeptide (TPR) repeat protein